MSNAGVKPMNDKDAGVRRVAWCITMPIKGGGGFRTIFENAKALQRAGYACDFYLAAQEGISTTAEKLRAKLCEWFGITPDGVYVLASKLQVECSLVIATLLSISLDAHAIARVATAVISGRMWARR